MSIILSHLIWNLVIIAYSWSGHIENVSKYYDKIVDFSVLAVFKPIRKFSSSVSMILDSFHGFCHKGDTF